MHFLNEIIIAGVILALVGPKALQSLARNLGKGVGHTKQAKEKILADLPVDEFNKVKKTFNQVPLTPQQVSQRAFQTLLGADEQKKEVTKAADPDVTSKPIVEAALSKKRVESI